MCDTMVALGPAGADGATLFAKNSDREPDETQNLVILPGSRHEPGETVKCTYISIPQAEETYAVLLCRPFWMFGAEMGANEHGVVIGNEAVFTKEKPEQTGLLGMDLIRLGLERGRTAKEAMQVIIALLEEHGQGGNCGYRQKIRYMNSFILADAREAYVLETVKRWWAWKKVQTSWSISNILSLTNDFDECSPGLIENAARQGWRRGRDDFSLRDCYSDTLITHFARGRERESRSRKFLAGKNGRLATRDMMEALRDHGPDPTWRPDRQRGGTVCMHAHNRLTRPSQSVGSMVARIGSDRKSFYVTGASNPCLSPFFPVFAPGTALPSAYKPGNASFDPESYWWSCERLHRKAMKRFHEARETAAAMIESYEKDMIAAVEHSSGPLGQEAIDSLFGRALDLVKEWGGRLDQMKGQRLSWLYKRHWNRYNRINNVPA